MNKGNGRKMVTKTHKKKVFINICALLLLAILVYFITAIDNNIQYVTVLVEDQDLPSVFSDFKIVLITDFHSYCSGESYDKIDEIVYNILAFEPDIVVLTGDMIDKSLQDESPTVYLLEKLTPHVKVYGVSGNHEKAIAAYEDIILPALTGADMIDLDDSSAVISRDGEIIRLHGLADLGTTAKYNSNLMAQIHKNNPDENSYNILLFHRANYLDYFSETNYNLILSGHIHGGQIRVPFLGGVVSPDISLFPKYDSGLYRISERVQAYVSRGVGSSRNYPRLHNPPEVTFITLAN